MKRLRVVVVGPCASGKTTLVERLRALGYESAYTVPQEHSVIRCLWAKGCPDFLIYLDVSYEALHERRGVPYSASKLEDQEYRLRHAREHADVYLMTDGLSAEHVLHSVIEGLGKGKMGHGHRDPGDSEERRRGPSLHKKG